MERFYDLLTACIDDCVSKIKIRPRKYPIWFTTDLICPLKQKNVADKHYKASQSQESYAVFLEQRKELKQAKKRAYNEYLCDMQDQIIINGKRFWSFVNSRRKNRSLPTSLTYNGSSAVSGTASSPGLSDQERYPLFLRLYPSDTILVPGWEALLRYFRWKKVAIIYEDVEMFSLLMKELVLLFEDHGGYEVLTVEHVQSGFEPTNQIQSLKNHNARIIIILAYPQMTRQITCQAYRMGLYGRKYVWMLPGWLSSNWYLGPDGENGVTCSEEQMKSALEGYLGIKVLSYTKDFNKVNFHGVVSHEINMFTTLFVTITRSEDVKSRQPRGYQILFSRMNIPSCKM
ncbi:gamma-aminobutyric acid type B receptor subunit 2-like [Ptychodera flava]|uniref:gamma-aminobutyric acid type B receptor subunit 2-like n=1 Tax=Ptychodera flava TaxID=63121 RepID=UPI00396A0A06